MKQPNKKKRDGIVYSTDPDHAYHFSQEAEPETLEPRQQVLRVSLDRKNRGGKEATLVSGFVGSDADLESLAKVLKTRCGVGGGAKDGLILIQGNHKEKICLILKDLGYSQTKISGG